MKVAVVVVLPFADWETYEVGVARFARTYRQFPAGYPHDLVLLRSNYDGRDYVNAFGNLPAVVEDYAGWGWDIGAFLDVSRRLEHDLVLYSGSRSYFWRKDWLRPLVQAREDYGDGLFGVTASYEASCMGDRRVPPTCPFPNPHIRTNCFACSPKVLRDFPQLVQSRNDCYSFESGVWNFSRWFSDQGRPALLVTWDGVYPRRLWRRPANVFRKGNQQNILIWDRHTKIFADAPMTTKQLLGRSAGV